MGKEMRGTWRSRGRVNYNQGILYVEKILFNKRENEKVISNADDDRHSAVNIL